MCVCVTHFNMDDSNSCGFSQPVLFIRLGARGARSRQLSITDSLQRLLAIRPVFNNESSLAISPLTAAPNFLHTNISATG